MSEVDYSQSATFQDIERRLSRIEEQRQSNIDRMDQREAVVKEFATGKYNDLIEKKSHGYVSLLTDRLSKKLGFSVGYHTVYYILKNKGDKSE